MVELSRSIANKIKDKQGDITEDEVGTCKQKQDSGFCRFKRFQLHVTIIHPKNSTDSSVNAWCCDTSLHLITVIFVLQTIRFKSYLLSMGIANPVTRETHGSGTHYHLQLAKQLGDMLQAPLEVCGHFCVICFTCTRANTTNSFHPHFLFHFYPRWLFFSDHSLRSQERGGMMALTEVYCLVNRARGMEVMLTFVHTFTLHTNVFCGLSDTEVPFLELFPHSFCLQRIWWTHARCLSRWSSRWGELYLFNVSLHS